MARIARVSHVVLNVSDPEASAEWYRDVLGMEWMNYSPGLGMSFMSFGTLDHDMALIEHKEAAFAGLLVLSEKHGLIGDGGARGSDSGRHPPGLLLEAGAGWFVAVSLAAGNPVRAINARLQFLVGKNLRWGLVREVLLGRVFRQKVGLRCQNLGYGHSPVLRVLLEKVRALAEDVVELDARDDDLRVLWVVSHDAGEAVLAGAVGDDECHRVGVGGVKPKTNERGE